MSSLLLRPVNILTPFYPDDRPVSSQKLEEVMVDFLLRAPPSSTSLVRDSWVLSHGLPRLVHGPPPFQRAPVLAILAETPRMVQLLETIYLNLYRNQHEQQGLPDVGYLVFQRDLSEQEVQECLDYLADYHPGMIELISKNTAITGLQLSGPRKTPDDAKKDRKKHLSLVRRTRGPSSSGWSRPAG